MVGTATALALAADGHTVTLFDHGEVGAGTSFGNAGAIVTGAVTPTATPGVIRSIPSYVFDPNSAAVLRPGASFPGLPWLSGLSKRAGPAGFKDRSGAASARVRGHAGASWPWPA
jgi:D-amino-acid dehydrogenase